MQRQRLPTHPLAAPLPPWLTGVAVAPLPSVACICADTRVRLLTACPAATHARESRRTGVLRAVRAGAGVHVWIGAAEDVPARRRH